jgi:hypothetical protein
MKTQAFGRGHEQRCGEKDVSVPGQTKKYNSNARRLLLRKMGALLLSSRFEGVKPPTST